MNIPVPTNITLHRASHVLEVAFDGGENFRLSAEYLRVNSPSAEVQGHGPGQKVLVAGKANVNIDAVEPVGNYAVLLRFDDGHATGLFSWDVLYTLGASMRATGRRIWTSCPRAAFRGFLELARCACSVSAVV